MADPAHRKAGAHLYGGAFRVEAEERTLESPVPHQSLTDGSQIGAIGPGAGGHPGPLLSATMAQLDPTRLTDKCHQHGELGDLDPHQEVTLHAESHIEGQVAVADRCGL
jgi:hypothetical protein